MLTGNLDLRLVSYFQNLIVRNEILIIIPLIFTFLLCVGIHIGSVSSAYGWVTTVVYLGIFSGGLGWKFSFDALRTIEREQVPKLIIVSVHTIFLLSVCCPISFGFGIGGAYSFIPSQGFVMTHSFMSLATATDMFIALSITSSIFAAVGIFFLYPTLRNFRSQPST